MVKTKGCAYGSCKSYSHSLNDSSIFFVKFPKPKSNLLKCQDWLAKCGRLDDFSVKNVNRGTFVCSLHFVGNKGPTKEHPDIIDYRETEEYKIYKRQHDFCSNVEKHWQETVNLNNLIRKGTQPADEENDSSVVQNEPNSSILIKDEIFEPPNEEYLNLLSTTSKVNGYTVLSNEETLVSLYVYKSEDGGNAVLSNEENQDILCTTRFEDDGKVDFSNDGNFDRPNTSKCDDILGVSLATFLADFDKLIPNEWAFSYNSTSKRLTFLKYSELHQSITISISLVWSSNSNLPTIAIKVLNRSLPGNHPAVVAFLNTFTDTNNINLSDITRILGCFDKFVICKGLDSTKFKDEIEFSWKKEGHFSWYDNTLHSSSCAFLSDNNICTSCKSLKATLTRRINRNKISGAISKLSNKEIKQTRKSFRRMSRVQLLKHVQKLNKKQRYIKTKMLKLKLIHRKFKEQGQVLDKAEKA